MLAELVDEPARLLLAAVEAVRSTPAPVGMSAARLAVLAHASAELQGVYLQAVATADVDGTAAEHHCRGAADLLSQTAGLPVSQARSDAGLARRLGRLPGLLDALSSGRVTVAAGRLVARAWSALPAAYRDTPTADALLVVAADIDLAELQGKVDELVAALAPEVLDGDHADAYDARDLTFADVGSQTTAKLVMDRLDGEQLRGLVQARANADRGGPDDTRTQGQRLFDALLSLVRGAADAGLVPDGTATTSELVVITPVDALLDLLPSQQPSLLDTVPGATAGSEVVPGAPPSQDALDSGDLAEVLRRARGGHGATAGRPGPDGLCLTPTARTRGGVHLGPRTLRRLSCAASFSRLLLDPAGHPLDSGPTRRQLNRRERRALEHRDGYRCQRRGCGRPASSCDPHHVEPWHLGGLTVLVNMLLLCRACHHQLHDREVQLPLRDGRVIGPRGWVRGPEPP